MQLTPKEQLEIFGTVQVGGEGADEAERRWGEGEAFQESQRRAASYTKDDWARLKEESDSALRGFAEAMTAGQPVDGPVAGELAVRHRDFLGRWFYDCPPQLHRQLALTYLEDDRFRAAFDAVAPGLADYVSGAIIANVDAGGS